ncbi:hypothetical protein ENUP19_0036G0062 [Entamoeba nuttalli]
MKMVSLMIDDNTECQQQFAKTKITLYRGSLKKEMYALDRVVPISLGSPNIDIQLAAYEIFLSYLKNNSDAQLSIASTLLPLARPNEDSTIGNNIINSFFKKDNVRIYTIASMLLNTIFLNPMSRYVFQKPMNINEDKTFLEVFIDTVASTDERAKALSLLKILVTVTYEADNNFLLNLMNETLFTYLLLKSSDSDLFHSSLACIILFNVLNELKFNSAPHSNTEMIDKISRAIDTIGFEQMKKKLDNLLISKEFIEAETQGISTGMLFDRESVRFITKIVQEVKEKRDVGEQKLKEREVQNLKEELEELKKKNEVIEQMLTESQNKVEDLNNQLELERALNGDNQEMKEQKEVLSQENEALAKKLTLKEESIIQIQQQIDTQKKEETELIKKNEELQNQLKQSEEEIKKLKENQTKLEELLKIQKVNENECGKVQTELNMVKAQLIKMQDEAKEKNSTIGELENKLMLQENNILQLKEEIVSKEKEKMEMKLELDSITKTNLIQSESINNNWKNEKESLLKEIDSLKEQLDSKSDELLLNQMQLDEYIKVNDELNQTVNNLNKQLNQFKESFESINKEVADSFNNSTEIPQEQPQQEDNKTTSKIIQTPQSTEENNEKNQSQTITDPTTAGVQIPTVTMNDLISTIHSIFN